MPELKRNEVFILRIDGEDLKEYLSSTQFESDIITIFSQIEASNTTLQKCIMKVLEHLTVDHGMPPSSDPWVFDNIVEPALQLLSLNQFEQSASQEIFLQEFRNTIYSIIKSLQEHPVIVARTENTFDGVGIRRLLSNNSELNELLDLVWKDAPKESNASIPREIFQVAFNNIAASAELPRYGTVDEVDAIMDKVFGMLGTDDEGKTLQEAQFKKTITEILGRLVQQLEANPILITSNSVVHEPLASPSTVLPRPSLVMQPDIEQ